MTAAVALQWPSDFVTRPDVSERLVDTSSAQGVHRAGRAGPLSSNELDKSDLPRSETSGWSGGRPQ